MTDEPKPSITPLSKLMRVTFYVKNAIKRGDLSLRDQKISADLVQCTNDLATGILSIKNEMSNGTINFKEAQEKIDKLLSTVSGSIDSPDLNINTNYDRKSYTDYGSHEKWKYPTDKDVLRITEEIAKLITAWSNRFVPEKNKDWRNK